MADKLINYNPAQQVSVILQPNKEVQIAGRGLGKSAGIGHKIHLINTHMPRSVTSITGKTYGQLLTRTLPSTMKFLEMYFGYVKDVHYVINRKPPKAWKNGPYEVILKHENFISFINGTGYLLLSQDRAGSARGPNTDFEIVDEALTIDPERYHQEVSPTNRANMKIFRHVPFHNGFHFTSSMPFSTQGRWLLDYSNYYHEEAGIRILDIWNRVIKMQMDLLEITNPKEFAAHWNEISKVRSQMSPFVSKTGLLFTLSNAFDNLDHVGLQYLINEYQKLPPLIFLIEIMNWVPDKVEDAYYNIDPELHVYYDAYNNSYITDLAEDSNYDFNKLGSPHSLFDVDCDPNAPIEAVFDWGSNMSYMFACQENNLVEKNKSTSFNYLKEFFVKPERRRVMVDDLIDEFCNYYQYHNDRTVYYWRDKYGDISLANSSVTYNEQAISRFVKNGWAVVQMQYRGKEPPHHDKYLFWSNIFKENNERFPVVRINGNNCKYFIIAANNTRVMEKDNKFKKDKSSENNSSIAPEEATHSTDAADKIVWYKYGKQSRNNSGFVPARM